MENTNALDSGKWKKLEGNGAQVVKKHEESFLVFKKKVFMLVSILISVLFAIIIVFFLFIGTDAVGKQIMLFIIVGDILFVTIYYFLYRNDIKNTSAEFISGKQIYYQLIHIKLKRSVTIARIPTFIFELSLDNGKEQAINVDTKTFHSITKTIAIAVTGDPTKQTIHYILPLEFFTFNDLGLTEENIVVHD